MTDTSAFDESARYFQTPLQLFQYYTKYSRFNYEKGRRETWIETVERAVNYLRKLSDDKLSNATYNRIQKSILNMEVMPSMRLLAMAGPAADRNNLVLYNCAATPVDSLDSFVEALLISMSGCGIAFSVEKQYVDQLPIVAPQTGEFRYYSVEDSAEGWGDALAYGLQAWFNGSRLEYDFSLLRPEGAPLKIKGGRSSGPDPLRTMLHKIESIVLGAQGRKLTTTEAHEIMCLVGSAAVSGGHRRTAMLSLFDAYDAAMRGIKSGNLKGREHLYNANNSAVWPEGIGQAQFLSLYNELVSSGRGEPGIFYRQGAINTKPNHRKESNFLTNPCGEVILRPNGLCNLSVAVARSWDTAETLKEKVAIATIIGTIQSMATHFPGLRPEWKQNCEEERLLGVDITGQMDCPVLRTSPELMRELRQIAVHVNAVFARKLKINQSASVTVVKPSGNSSQLLNCSSGLHPRWAPYYLRRVRISRTDPIFFVLGEAGVEMEPAPEDPTEMNWVVTFPVKSPEGAITRSNLSAIEQCEYWLMNKLNWTTHNPSVTIQYKEHEVLDLMNWIWHNRDRIGGMAFLPYSDVRYEAQPYEEITQEEYERRIAEFPYIDFSRVMTYETSDMTTSAQELACMSGSCDI